MNLTPAQEEAVRVMRNHRVTQDADGRGHYNGGTIDRRTLLALSRAGRLAIDPTGRVTYKEEEQ